MKNNTYRHIILRSTFSALFCGLGYLGWQLNSILQIINHTVDASIVDVVTDPSKKDTSHESSYIILQTLTKRLAKSTSLIDRFWDNVTFSYARRLLNLAQNENKFYRIRAVESLAKIKNLDDWHYTLLAHLCDDRTAVALARTENVDQRFFIKPPSRFIFDDEVHLTTWMKQFLSSLNERHNHKCLSLFLKKVFVNIQEIGHMVEHDISTTHVTPYFKETEELLPLCIHNLVHHSAVDDYAKDLVDLDGLPLLMEIYKHYKERDDVVENVVQIISNISVFPELLHRVYRSGWIGELSKLTKDPNVRISGYAAKTLANFDLDIQEHGKYERNIFLLHPLYRTNEHLDVDVVLVHGLLGGVFYTWRQRDCPANPFKAKNNNKKDSAVTRMAMSSDPSTRMYISEMENRDKLEWEEICDEYEVVLDDLPKDLDEKESYTCPGNDLMNDNNYSLKSQCWPKDWLPNDCKNLRILGINYDTNLSMWAPMCPSKKLENNMLEMRSEILLKKLTKIGIGQKPIIWLTHSMGGLLVKQMLVHAWNSNNVADKNICRNTKGIIFFSTPHRGTRVASLNQTSSLFLWPSVEVQELKENSPALLRLHDNFINMIESNGIKVCSFVETKSTIITPLKFNIEFVPEHSARLPIGEYYQVPLDHLRICKPVNRHSFLYQKVLSFIKHIVEEQKS